MVFLVCFVRRIILPGCNLISKKCKGTCKKYHVQERTDDNATDGMGIKIDIVISVVHD